MSFKAVDRLQKFIDLKLGLRRDELYLGSFNPRWKRIFSDEALFIFDELRIESLRLYHCGSSSVPDLETKPIIDILGSVASFEELDQRKQKLEDIGYQYKGEFGIKGRRYCILSNPEKSMSFVHLHIFVEGDPEIEKHLQLRDHLRKSPENRAAYMAQKRHLIEKVKIPKEQYSGAKNDIISKIQTDAHKQARQQNILAICAASDGHQNTLNFLKETYQDANLEIIDLAQAAVAPFSYQQNVDDSFHQIMHKSKEADLVVLATPVYWYAMSGAMKNFMDRFSNLMTGEHKSLGESLYGKRIQLLATGYDINLPLGFEVPFSCTSMYFGMDYMGAHYKSVRG